VPTTIEDRLVVGDASVLGEIYAEHGALVHTINQQLVGAAADRLTQQVFVESWRERLDFDPSRGTVRNWLVRRTRELVSDATPGSDGAVDRLVVGDSLARMDDVRRQVLLAGVDATDIEQLAEQLDLPVATVNGHLRRGMETLKGDIADSRPDGSYDALMAIMADGPGDVSLTSPSSEVWEAVIGTLGLGAHVHGHSEADVSAVAGINAQGNGGQSAHAGDGSQSLLGDPGRSARGDAGTDGTDEVDALRRPAESAKLNGGSWLKFLVALLVVLALVIAALIVL